MGAVARLAATEMVSTMQTAGEELRFGFGDNWKAFVQHVDDGRLAEAEKSVKFLLGLDRLDGKTFLDIGSGSGLFSLAARRLGARVHSFDFDPASVASTASLKERYFPGDADWKVEQGSVLDADYLRGLGSFDIVYSWGVLHHTGAMYQALEQAAGRVKPDGLFVFALYRKTLLCPAWTLEKRWYVKASEGAQRAARWLYIAALRAGHWVKGRSFTEFLRTYSSRRGMSLEHDVHDWMGGYPYESITPAQVETTLRGFGFKSVRSVTKGFEIGLLGSGCDEYVYARETAAS